MPYYTGLTAHLHSGFVGSFHPAASLRNVGFANVFARLAVNKPEALATPALVTLWVAYLVATLELLAYSIGVIKQTLVASWHVRAGVRSIIAFGKGHPLTRT